MITLHVNHYRTKFRVRGKTPRNLQRILDASDLSRQYLIIAHLRAYGA